MAVSKLVYAAGNNISDTLSASISQGASTIPVNSIALWPNKAFTVIVDRGNSAAEYIAISGISGSSLVVAGKGQQSTSDQGHNSGASVESVPTAGDWNNVIDSLSNLALPTTGALDTSKVVDLSTSQPLSNKSLSDSKVTKRVLSAASYTTDTGTALNCDNLDIFIVTAQAGALKLNNPTGTPVDGQMLFVAITGTAARALTYDTQFAASTVSLPSTTVTTNRLNMLFMWSAATSQWIILASV